ncbi:MAG TPA: hypothetical protein PLS37_07315 [Propioniciclava tarda]|nr:hypothetical protein [Propioniciclava tarda]
MTVEVPGLVVVRGAGDIATGVIQKLVHAGFAVVALETAEPMAIRWRAALATAVREARWVVEDLEGVRVASWAEASGVLAESHVRLSSGRRQQSHTWSGWQVPVLVDPEGALLGEVRPWAVVDAVLAKRNVGTTIEMAPVVVGLGPGFTAGVDCHYVIETMRGHELGRVIGDGPALPNTGIPGLIAGRAKERVLHAPASGVVRVVRGIGDVVEADEVVCLIEADDEPQDGGVAGPGDIPSYGRQSAAAGRPHRPHGVRAAIAGVIRGMIPDGARVHAGMKIADVDPRVELASSVDTISDKSRAVGGGALDAVLQGLMASGRWPAARV